MASRPPLTEEQWLRPKELWYVLDRLRGKAANASPRKLRLFAAACCRRLWHVLDDPRCQDAVAVAERFADGLATDEERARAFRAASRARNEHPEPVRSNVADEKTCAFYAASYVVAAQASLAVWNAPSYVRQHFQWKEPQRLAGEETALHRLLLDIFGNPFRPAAVDGSWLTPAVRGLAQEIEEQRTLPGGTLDPDRLAILADALEDAGCDNRQILDHCRGPGPHVRGCWVVDLLLARE